MFLQAKGCCCWWSSCCLCGKIKWKWSNWRDCKGVYS